MKCPHCQEGIHDGREYKWIGEEGSGEVLVHHMLCPECNKQFLYLLRTTKTNDAGIPIGKELECALIWPRQSSRSPAPADVPLDFADDFNEACLVLATSPKASAALSRRCLQHLLREKEGVKPGNLSDEIQQAIDGGALPSHITQSLDALREIGNFAAHPTKDQRTGEVLDVEPGEAEWTIETLESLFDFYFVSPAKAAARKAALNEKLRAAGRKEVP